MPQPITPSRKRTVAAIVGATLRVALPLFRYPEGRPHRGTPRAIAPAMAFWNDVRFALRQFRTMK